MFVVKKQITFTRKVRVEWPDNTSGTLTAEFRTIPQEELDDLMSEPDSVLVDRVLVSPGPVAQEGSNEPMPEEEARAAVMADTCSLSALAGEYLQATKGANFRRGKPGRSR